MPWVQQPPMNEKAAETYYRLHRLEVDISCSWNIRGTSLEAESEVARQCLGEPGSKAAWDIRNRIDGQRRARRAIGHTNRGPWEGGTQYVDIPSVPVVKKKRGRQGA